MIKFSELKKVPLREIWPHEASDFTPWLAENIQKLGDALGMNLAIIDREAPVGNFYLDLLARDLESSRAVVIENQYNQTDHDHLGKLLTYAGGFDVSAVIWISEEIQDAHRQALEWLNQRTDTETQFFGVVLEVLQIDDSNPALNFKLVVCPNEWQKSQKQRTLTSPSTKGEKYKSYFQELVVEMRRNPNFNNNIPDAKPNSWYSIRPGFPGVWYGAAFGLKNKVRTEVYIDQGDYEKNKNLFDELANRETEITSNFGSQLEWSRNDNEKMSRIAVYRDGDIEKSSDDELEEIREWHIANLLKLKEVFTPKIKKALETLNSSEKEES